MKYIIGIIMIAMLVLSACASPQEATETSQATPEKTTESAAEEKAPEAPAEEKPAEPATAPKETPSPEPVKPAVTTPAATTTATTNATPTTLKEGIIKKGQMQTVERDAHGIVELVYEKGKKFVRMTNITIENPSEKELRVVLSEHTNPKKWGEVKRLPYNDLGKYDPAKTEYDIPADVNINNMASVVIFQEKPVTAVYAAAHLLAE